jgi:hypothetical protein
MQGDVALVAGDAADELADRIPHPKLAHHLELQDRCGGELLRHRHDVVDGVAARCDARLAVRHPEARAVRHLAVASGDQRAAGPLGQGVVEKPLDRRSSFISTSGIG